MQAQLWGIKTMYYSLVNKAGSKQQEDAPVGPLEIIDFDDVEDCIACKL
jgi:hypothetical protein